LPWKKIIFPINNNTMFSLYNMRNTVFNPLSVPNNETNHELVSLEKKECNEVGSNIRKWEVYVIIFCDLEGYENISCLRIQL
jgi:hypothetical protein